MDSHHSFAEGRRLKMPLLSDTDRSVAHAYGVIGPLGLRRSVFVVDAGGRIAWRRVVALNVRSRRSPRSGPRSRTSAPPPDPAPCHAGGP